MRWAARAAGGGVENKKQRGKKEGGGGKDHIQVTKQFIDACLHACDVQIVKDHAAHALTSRKTAQTAWSSVFRMNHHPDPSKKKAGAAVVTVRGKSTLEYAYYLLIASNSPEHATADHKTVPTGQ